MDNQLKKKVIDVVNRISDKKIDNIDINADLTSQLKLDSIQLVELFAALEVEFGMELPLEMMTTKNGATFLKLLENTLTTNIVN